MITKSKEFYSEDYLQIADILLFPVTSREKIYLRADFQVPSKYVSASSMRSRRMGVIYY
jgi:hypothetical protein